MPSHLNARPTEGGQTTTEYALVLLGAAAIALLLAAWATGGGISGLFDAVVDKILSGVT
jgi:hypothetical protein